MFQYLLPEYIEGRGDCSRLKENDSERVIYKGINTVIRNIYNERCLSFDSIRKRCSKTLNQKNLIPMYLGKDEVIIPVKVRSNIIKGDCLYGYVNYSFIERIYNDYIIFKDKSRIDILENRKSVVRRYRMAETVEKDFEEDEKFVREFFTSSKEVATKEDIALILLEMKKLERKMNS